MKHEPAPYPEPQIPYWEAIDTVMPEWRKTWQEMKDFYEHQPKFETISSFEESYMPDPEMAHTFLYWALKHGFLMAVQQPEEACHI